MNGPSVSAFRRGKPHSYRDPLKIAKRALAKVREIDRVVGPGKGQKSRLTPFIKIPNLKAALPIQPPC